MILMDDLVPTVARETAAEVTADLTRETRCKRQVFDTWLRKRNEWRRRREEFEMRMIRFERDVGGLGIASPMSGGVRRQAREFGGRRRGGAEEVEDVMIKMERVRVGEEGWDERLVRAVDEVSLVGGICMLFFSIVVRTRRNIFGLTPFRSRPYHRPRGSIDSSPRSTLPLVSGPSSSVSLPKRTGSPVPKT